MISNCEGCKYEMEMAYEESDHLHLVQQEITHIGERRHFRIYMVDDNGKRMIW